MNRILIAIMAAAISLLTGTAGAAQMDVSIEKAPPFGSGPYTLLYRVLGPGTELEINNGAFAAGPFSQYELTGRLYGRTLAAGSAVRHETFASTKGMQLESGEIRTRFFRRQNWPEMEAYAELPANVESRTILFLSSLADYLPALPGADHPPLNLAKALKFRLSNLGPDTILVSGDGIENMLLVRTPLGGGYRYTARGRGFGKNFDGPDRFEVETNPDFLGRRGFRARTRSMDIEAREDSFGRGRFSLRGEAGDSAALAFFVTALMRYISES